MKRRACSAANEGKEENARTQALTQTCIKRLHCQMFCGAFHERLQKLTLLQIPALPVRSERIRPFDDGNGRLG